MMNLHTDKKTFTDIIDTVSEETSTARDIIEKDYYVTLIMKEFFSEEEGLVFKGGTSLSKGYHLINRFSEDIDLNYIDHDALSRSKRKQIKYALKDVAYRYPILKIPEATGISTAMRSNMKSPIRLPQS
jgi:hypothetical protein